MAGSEGLLPQSVLRAAGDKLYERRKTAALEVEQTVKTLDAQVAYMTHGHSTAVICVFLTWKTSSSYDCRATLQRYAPW